MGGRRGKRRRGERKNEAKTKTSTFTPRHPPAVFRWEGLAFVLHPYIQAHHDTTTTTTTPSQHSTTPTQHNSHIPIIAPLVVIASPTGYPAYPIFTYHNIATPRNSTSDAEQHKRRGTAQTPRSHEAKHSKRNRAKARLPTFPTSPLSSRCALKTFTMPTRPCQHQRLRTVF